LRTDEGRPVRFHVPFDLAPQELVAKFETPLDDGAGDLIAPASAIGSGLRWPAVTPRDALVDPLAIVAVCDPVPSSHEDGVAPRRDDLLFHAHKCPGVR
jgi:hypothetical protein